MPFGGKQQLTPAQAMAAKLPVCTARPTTCSGMAWGFNPVSDRAQTPTAGAYLAVVEIASPSWWPPASTTKNVYLTFQEYFEQLRDEPERWGKPLAALLGALDAQMGLGVAAIGGKDSMSGTLRRPAMFRPRWSPLPSPSAIRAMCSQPGVQESQQRRCYAASPSYEDGLPGSAA